MSKIVSSTEAAGCLSVLESAVKPMTAAEMAVRLNITAGSRESRRRRIRGIVKYLRENGSRIVATNKDGYWLTERESIWRGYLQDRSVDARRILGEMHNRKRAMNEAKQMPLFHIGKMVDE